MQFEGELRLSTEQKSLFGSIVCIGALVGALAGGPMLGWAALQPKFFVCLSLFENQPFLGGVGPP